MTDEKPIPWRVQREKCAVLVIDMQNDFLKPGGVLYVDDIAMRAVPNIRRLIDRCRGASVPVIYTQALLKDGFAVSPLEAAYAPVLFEKGLREGTWGADFIDELKPRPEDQIVKKFRYDAFYNTNLELVLNNIRGLGTVDTVIITGTVTNVCCESTARAAFMRDYKVVFVSDGCGAFDEDAHHATLKSIGRFFGRVMDTDAVIQALGDGETSLTAILD